MIKSEIITGCSSYYNRKWIGIFYPEDLPSKEWFGYYCKYFSTYELNSTFYKSPTAKSLAIWYKTSPPNFTFSVKAPKLVTHIKKFEDCQREIDEFYMACSEGLHEKLGCILFQLPPSFHFTPERLQMICESLDPAFNNAVEFRHESWWIPEVFNALTASNISFCAVNYPKLPTQIIKTNHIGYIRLHGNPRLFYSQYTNHYLAAMLAEIQQLKFEKTFIYFNNTASEGAIINALEIIRQLV